MRSNAVRRSAKPVQFREFALVGPGFAITLGAARPTRSAFQIEQDARQVIVAQCVIERWRD